MKVNVGKDIVKDFDLSLIGIDESALQPVAAHMVMLGIRNAHMDAHASITVTAFPDATARLAAAVAMVDKKWAGYVAGQLRTASTRVSSIDPVKAEAIKLAKAAIWAKVGKKADAKAVAAKAIELHERFLVQARKNVETAAKLAADLGDIEL